MYYRKTRRFARRSLIRLIITCAIIAAALLAVYFLFFSEFKITKDPALDLEKSYPENTVLASSGLISFQNNILSLDSIEGENIWNLTIDNSQTDFTHSDAMISTYGTNSAQFFTHNKEQLFSVSLDTAIDGVACGTDYACILTSGVAEDFTEHSYIYIYDKSGKNTGKVDLLGNEILDFGIYGKSDMVWALSLDTGGVVPYSYLTTYKGDGTITGSIGLNTQIIEKAFVTDSQIFLSGTNSLNAYSYFAESQGETLIYGWRPYDRSVSGSNIGILYVTRESSGESITSVKVIDQNFNDTMLYFPADVFETFIAGSNVFAVSPYAVYIYTNGVELTKTIEFETPITGVKKLSDSSCLIWTAGTTQILNF